MPKLNEIRTALALVAMILAIFLTFEFIHLGIEYSKEYNKLIQKTTAPLTITRHPNG